MDSLDPPLSSLIELSSVALGGTVVAVSDEFFAEAFHLLEVKDAPNLKGQFGPNGALYSGWESRRHNPTFDWCVVKLGLAGIVVAVDIDTSHFNGNEAPAASLLAVNASGNMNPVFDDKEWKEILPLSKLGPSQHHIFRLEGSSADQEVTHIQLRIFPDGGVARLRVYGTVSPPRSVETDITIDLAHCSIGGRVVLVSDQHFGKGNNLILPGRGIDMGDGWETKRSRQSGHRDWAIIRLGLPGHLSYIEIDTNHFLGNFPESVEIHATKCHMTTPSDTDVWTLILPRAKLAAHRRQYFQLDCTVFSCIYTHIRVTIHPDGGIKRVRVHGRPATEDVVSFPQEDMVPTFVALPLTAEAFSPYGSVIQAQSDTSNPFHGSNIYSANMGTALKFTHDEWKVSSKFPDDAQPRPIPSFSIYRTSPTSHITWDKTFQLELLERHPYNNQAFFALGSASSPLQAYLVIVAQTDKTDSPDCTQLRAFVAKPNQGVLYNAATWHHPIIALDVDTDFACVETQVGDKSEKDCELFHFTGANKPTVYLPDYTA